ncbi:MULTISPECIES: hypothetical protein [Klebsiella]|uniref:baseplate complex protein n=1 Tax=Klebsiella TaxID=570 RepID=UPI000666D924|nr:MULTISPECIES: hypothetical protein [Klebsiella]HBR1708104.1 hypothetical protein [Klebsiella quasipneumoniae subsp. similipneumoniae]HCI6750878.1 hypothetical protein [Klebsiella quasipneumoniae subsp. quasipneumoniae]EKU5181779.1 hypothetical protein [Klebsiella oxytoca]ELT9694300.1 hypothetical protein [Klebsiella oxytoca]MBZ7719568.1 hypothetical protein [Klebsiella oxytoca]
MTQIIVLALDGEAILMKNILVTPSMQIQDKDQSGQASSTANAEQGIKAKELRVSGLIPFADKAQLTRLFALAEAKNDSGGMKRYRVAHEVAQAIKFREATFSGNVDAAPQTDRMAWLVNFTLKEYFSVAERKAMQAASAGAGSATAQTAGGTGSAEESAEKLSWFEGVLKKIDTAIGPAGGEQ